MIKLIPVPSIEQTIENMDIMIIYDFLCVIVSLAWPFGLCYGATLASDAGFSTGYMVYQSDWYNFSNDLIKYMQLIIAKSQREITFNGFKLVGCNMQKFVLVKYIFSFEKKTFNYHICRKKRKKKH